METNSSLTKSPTFHYGRYDIDPTSGLNTQNVLGDADSGTWNTGRHDHDHAVQQQADAGRESRRSADGHAALGGLADLGHPR